MPKLRSKEWLEHDCLACNARYDIRIYPSESNGSVNVHKRLINSSSEVDKAIEGKNEKGTEIQKDSQSH